MNKGIVIELINVNAFVEKQKSPLTFVSRLFCTFENIKYVVISVNRI